MKICSLIFVSFILLSCKTSNKSDAEVSSTLTGKATGRTCENVSKYHQRLSSELDYLGEEFIKKCSDKNAYKQLLAKGKEEQNTDTIYLPQLFQKNSQLAKLNILSSLQSDFVLNGHIANFDQQCKEIIVTMKDRADEIISNKAGISTCCVNSGVNPKDLRCLGSAPYPREEKQIYFEWPVCGKSVITACSTKNLIANENCTRCEIRSTVDQSYDQKLAHQSRMTCLTPQAARGAIATNLIYYCAHTPEASICKNVSFNLPIKDLYSTVDQFLHCEKVNLDVHAVNEQADVNITGTEKSLEIGRTLNIGGEFALSGKIGAFAKVSGSVAQVESSSYNSFSRLSTESQSFFVYRDGRQEVNSHVQANCGESITLSSCTNATTGVEFSFELPIVSSVSASAKASTGNCVSKKLNANLASELPFVGGMTMEQVQFMCEKFTEQSSTVSSIYNALKDLRDPGKLSGVDFLQIDIKNKNLYCTDKDPRFENYSDEEMLKGQHIQKLSLRARDLPFSGGKLTYYIVVEGAKTKLLDSKFDFSASSVVENYSHESFKDIMGPVVKNDKLLKIIETYLQNKSVRSAHDLSQKYCRYVNAPVQFEQLGLECTIETPNNDKINIDSIAVQIVLNDILLTAKTNRAEFNQPLKDKRRLLGTWSPKLVEGAFNSQDAVELLKVMAKSQKSMNISNCKISK